MKREQRFKRLPVTHEKAEICRTLRIQIVASVSKQIKTIKIKRVLLAVAQSWSLYAVHEAYLCKSCFRNAIYQHFNFMKKGQVTIGYDSQHFCTPNNFDLPTFLYSQHFCIHFYEDIMPPDTSGKSIMVPICFGTGAMNFEFWVLRS